MEDNIALITSGFIFMRFVELMIVSYFLYRVIRRNPRPSRVRLRTSNLRERARTAHSDKD